MLDALVALVVPPRCVACARPMPAGRGMCSPCRAELVWIPDACPRCALPRPCGPPCPAGCAAFSASWAPLAFEGSARALVHALKFKGRTAAAKTMAAQITANASRGLLDGAAAVVPAPADPARRRHRGFDHALLLAQALSRRAGLPLVAALTRPPTADRQLGKGRTQRRAGMTITARRQIHGRVVLVDDVHTTGATLDACAAALRQAGASDIVAITYVRTLG